LYDYALLRLEKAVSEEYFKTFIPLAYDFGQQNIEASVYGYPVDRTEETIKIGGTQIYYRQCGHQNKIESIKDGRIYHRCDTTPGQSGSPIITNIKAKSYAIGMHIQSGS